MTALPPRLISSLRAGFDTTASHIGLILLPILLDLFLWLGPRFKLQALFQAVSAEMQAIAEINTPEMLEMWNSARQLWLQTGEQFNLGITMRTYPIGLPSLMAGQLPAISPIGQPMVIDVNNLGTTFLWWMAFTVIGLVLGSQYFNAVAIAAGGVAPQKQARPLWAIIQVIVLTIACAVLALLLIIPAMLILSLLSVLSPAIAQLAVLVFSVFLIWVLVPLLFSPHGIFMYRQNALTSMLTSMRLMRFILPGTGLFFLTLVVLSQGLDLLWQVPPHDSWLSVVGIAGHAFITTALLASSFVYYRDATAWVQEFLQKRIGSQNRVA